MAFRAMAALAMALIDRLSAHDVGRIVLSRHFERRRERGHRKKTRKSSCNNVHAHRLHVGAVDLLSMDDQYRPGRAVDDRMRDAAKEEAFQPMTSMRRSDDQIHSFGLGGDDGSRIAGSHVSADGVGRKE